MITGLFPELAELVRMVVNHSQLFFSWVSELLYSCMGVKSARTGAKYADTKKEKVVEVWWKRIDLSPFFSIGWLDLFTPYQGALSRL